MLAAIAAGQDVIGAKSGLIHHILGDVRLNGELIHWKSGTFPEVKTGQELRTELGRAEVLLAPGTFLRLSENSAIRMIGNQIEDTRIELLAGSILIEAGEFNAKEQALRITVREAALEVERRGLYRIDYDPAQLRVFEGAMTASAGGDSVTIKEGRETALNAALAPQKFDREKGDAFHRWAARRSGYIALANISAAKRVSDNSLAWRVSDWIYNPYFGAFTWIPASGLFRSPFGYAFYSPHTIERVFYRPPVYTPAPTFAGGMGPRAYPDSMGRGSMGGYSGSSSGSMSAPPPPAVAAPAGGARTAGDTGGSRSTAGGR
jgi:hypothetical protein